MQVQPKRTYSIHQDGVNEIRYHIAVQTTPDTYFMYGDTLELNYDILGGGKNASRFKKASSCFRWKWKKKRTRRLQKKRRKMRLRAR